MTTDYDKIDKLQGAYDERNNDLYKKVTNLLNNFIILKERKTQILEIGAGTGYISEKLKNMGFSVTVSDLNTFNLM